MQAISTPTTSTTEGVVVRTAVKAGADRLSLNHSEGVVVRSAVKAGGQFINHAEGIVVRSAVKAGYVILNHAEGVVGPEAAAGTTDSAQRWGRHHRSSGDQRVTEPGSASPPATWPADADAVVIEF